MSRVWHSFLCFMKDVCHLRRWEIFFQKKVHFVEACMFSFGVIACLDRKIVSCYRFGLSDTILFCPV